MVDLAMTSTAIDESSLSVGYSCPCGCTPVVTYRRHDIAATEGCCCGNEMAVGPDAATRLSLREGFELRLASVATPWRDTLPVAWAIGPSTHPAEHHDHAGSLDSSEALDPVCGMIVEIETALTKGLHTRHGGADYYFCGKGCRLDFDEDPGHYRDASYLPSM